MPLQLSHTYAFFSLNIITVQKKSLYFNMYLRMDHITLTPTLWLLGANIGSHPGVQKFRKIVD
jgi:hypothetical protein